MVREVVRAGGVGLRRVLSLAGAAIDFSFHPAAAAVHQDDGGLRRAFSDLIGHHPLVDRIWAGVRKRFPEIDEARLVPELVRDQIGLMVNDVLEEAARRVRDAGVETADDVRAAGRALAGFSAEMAGEERVLKHCLHARIYNAPEVTAIRDEAQRVLAGLFAAYRDDPSRLPDGWLGESADQVITLRGIGDFIAGRPTATRSRATANCWGRCGCRTASRLFCLAAGA